MKQVKKIKTAYSILAVCMILSGMIIMLRPTAAEDIMYKICGLILILLGVVKLMGYFSKDLLQLAFQFDFAMGIVFFTTGLFLIFETEKMIEYASVFMGIIVLTDALLRIQTTLDARKIGLEQWKLLLIISIVIAVTGVLILMIPLTGTRILIQLAGLNIFIDGILNLVIVRNTTGLIRRKDEWEI